MLPIAPVHTPALILPKGVTVWNNHNIENASLVYLEFVNKDNLNIMKYVYQNWLMINGNAIFSLLTGITLIDSLTLESERLIEVIL